MFPPPPPRGPPHANNPHLDQPYYFIAIHAFPLVASSLLLLQARPGHLQTAPIQALQAVPNSELIMEDEGYPTVQNPYNTKPLEEIQGVTKKLLSISPFWDLCH